MLLNSILTNLLSIALVNQSAVVTVLIVVVVFFGILLILGVLKSYKLKKDNERINEMDTKMPEDNEYKDFTDGHMYGGDQ